MSALSQTLHGLVAQSFDMHAGAGELIAQRLPREEGSSA